MRKLILSLLLTTAMGASACTNFIVAKGASTDGSVICTYNADDYGGTPMPIMARYPRHLRPTTSSETSTNTR